MNEKEKTEWIASYRFGWKEGAGRGGRKTDRKQ